MTDNKQLLLEDKLRIVRKHIEESDPAVPIIDLAHKLGIKVYNTDWPDTISGKIQKDETRGGSSGFAIFVNKNHAEVRRRFTIAHEIAHYVLHEKQIGDGVYDDGLYRSGLPNTVEVQANKLAADILMPWSTLKNDVIEYSNNVVNLAKRYNVSRSAMEVRLGVYGY